MTLIFFLRIYKKKLNKNNPSFETNKTLQNIMNLKNLSKHKFEDCELSALQWGLETGILSKNFSFKKEEIIKINQIYNKVYFFY